MKLRRVALATILTVLVAAPVTPAAAAQRTLVVDDDQQQCPKADYTSINAAIAAASTGDAIRVCPGLYDETVVVNKASLSLRGSTDGSSTEPCLRGDSAATDHGNATTTAEWAPAAAGRTADRHRPLTTRYQAGNLDDGSLYREEATTCCSNHPP